MPRIVLLSFGLKRRTKQALEQARRFGHPIHLVPAIPRATRGLGTHASSLVTVHTEVGRAGLLAAIEDMQNDVVLMLHEDVLLHADAAHRLIDVSTSTGMTSVPSTNHTDVDGPAGMLPPDVVQPLGEPTEPYPIERARTVCLASPAFRIRGLVHQNLTQASTRLYFADKAALLVSEAVATHLDEGPDQLEDPVGPDGRPLLVASMIVRDEEQFLEDCLASLDGLVDRIDICDTGSTDRTIEIAEAAGARIKQVEWQDDFAWARNQALEMSRDAWWVLQIDADERARVEDPVQLRRALATAIPDAEGFDVPLHDIATDGADLGGQQLPRIFPGATTRFLGRVHEVAQFSDGTPIAWAVSTHLEIEHHGYRPEVVAARDKQARNLRLARADHEANPSAVSAMQLARALPFGPERLDVLQSLYDDLAAGDKSLNEAGKVPIYQLFSHALLLEGNEDEAWRVIAEGRALFPHVPAIRAVHAEIGTKVRRHEEVAAAVREAAVQGEQGERPWGDSVAEAVTLIEAAKSHLALDDVAAAGAAMLELLEMPVLETIGRWHDIVSIVALSLPDRAAELLVRAAAADRSGRCMEAMATTFDPMDAAQLAAAVVNAADDPSEQQGAIATRIAVAADSPDAIAALAAALELSDEQLDELARGGGPRAIAWRQSGGRGVSIDEVVAAREAAHAAVTHLAEAPDEGDASSIGLAVAGDRSGAALQRLTREVPPPIAAPVAVAAVLAGLDSPGDVQSALAVCTIAGDIASMEAIREHLGLVDVEILQLLRRRATDKGNEAVASFLDSHLGDRYR